MRIHAYIIYYNKIIKFGHLPTMYKQPIILYNYTIFHAFCLESVYKLFRKNTLNMPAAGGTIGTENKGNGQPNKQRKEKKMKIMENYKNQIAMGFINEKELDEFLNTIADDEKLSARNYCYLRHFAIQRFYEN